MPVIILVTFVILRINRKQYVILGLFTGLTLEKVESDRITSKIGGKRTTYRAQLKRRE